MTETPERAELDAIKFLHAGDDRVWCVGCKRFAWCDGDNECPKDSAAECPIQHEPDDVMAPSLADAQEALDALAKECRDLDDSLVAAPLASSLGEPVSQEAPSIPLSDEDAKFVAGVQAGIDAGAYTARGVIIGLPAIIRRR